MFLLNTRKGAGFLQEIILSDETTKTSAVILPGCGAILHNFTVVHNGQAVNVIESYESDADFKSNAENKGFRNIKMSPFACRIKNARYSFDGAEYTIQKFLLNGCAIHGLLYNEPFTVSNTWANQTSAGVSLFFDYNATDSGYPFFFRCEVTYELKAGNLLSLTTSISNKSEKAIPLMDGWHPYFTFGSSINNIALQFNSSNIIEFDETLVPTGALTPYNSFNTFKKIGDTFFDNCFTLNNDSTAAACILKDEQQKLQIEIWANENYPYLQIYTPPHRQSIAVENLSAAPDAFNNGMGTILLEPEASVQFAAMYKISSLL